MATLSPQPLSNGLHGSVLHQMLADVRQYFFSRGEPLPPEFVPRRNASAASFAPVLMDGDPASPPAPDLEDAIRLIHAMATPAGHAAMLEALDHGLIDLGDAAVFDSAFELAMRFWRYDPGLLAQLHSELKRPEPQHNRRETQCAKPAETLSADQSHHTIERREMDDGVHWFVDGEDKGVLCKRPATDRALILDTLYERIGTGWVPHAFFMKHLDLSEKFYKGRMQKQLNHLRNILGVKIECRKDKGVRFAEDVTRR